MRIALSDRYFNYFKNTLPAPLSRAFEYIVQLSGYAFTPTNLDDKKPGPTKLPDSGKPRMIDYEVIRSYLKEMVKMYSTTPLSSQMLPSMSSFVQYSFDMCNKSSIKDESTILDPPDIKLASEFSNLD